MTRIYPIPRTSQETLACVTLFGVPLVHPAGHPRAGEVAQFAVRIPGTYHMTIRVPDVPSCWAKFRVDVDEYSRSRFRLVEHHYPQGDDDIEHLLQLIALKEVPPGYCSIELERDTGLLRLSQVAARLQVKPRRVYDLVKSGRLRAVRVGQQLRFRLRDVDAFLERNATE